MTHDRNTGPYDELASRLPFSLDDVARVNEIFGALQARRTRAEEVQIEVWTYCFVRRYFSAKLVRDDLARGADLDALMDRAYERIRRGRGSGVYRYGSWVSVVCKNTYLNYVRDRKVFVDVAAGGDPEPVDRDEPDLGTARATVDAAIGRLPSHLRSIARRRLVDDLEYEDIAREEGRPPATVRAYFHKAVKRLRLDPAVREVFGRGPTTGGPKADAGRPGSG